VTTLQDKADAMAETIRAIAGLCTYRHESKEDFIGRVRAVLGDDPDLRVSNIRKQRDDLLAALEKCRKELSAWMRDHGDDIGTREAVSEARAAIASAKSYGHPDKSAENETTIPAIIFYPAGSLGEEVAP
jgi:hypothetical protein